MYIEHLALWTNNLEEMKDFYLKYFDGKSNEKYFNPTKKILLISFLLKKVVVWNLCKCPIFQIQ